MKKIILSLLLLIVIGIIGFLAYASTLKKSTLVEQSIIINKNNQEVFNFILYFKNQLKYSVWAEMDPEMEREFTGIDGQLGSKHIWRSENPECGYGSLELSNIEQGKRLEWKLLFTKPFEANSMPYMNTIFIDSTTTKVEWGTDMTIPFPFNVVLESEAKKLGDQFANSLSKLKLLLEQ